MDWMADYINILRTRTYEITSITNITDKAGVPIDDQDGKSYSDEKLIELIDQSLQIMDTDLDGFVSFPEFVSAQASMKVSGTQ